MKIKSIELKNFKRFTDLRIENIPESANLVLLIGSNGSGKTSIFDAFEVANSNSLRIDLGYYKKDNNYSINVLIRSFKGDYTLNDTTSNRNLGSHTPFYGRTSFRQVPRLIRTQLGITQQEGKYKGFDFDRPKYYIDRDHRFENDIERICEIILREVFQHRNNSDEITKNFIDPINKALSNIFNSETNTIQLIEIIPPLDGNVTQLNFKKGISTIHYDFLSAGEKEVINILLNLLARKDVFKDTVYFFDEIDLHLNTKIQYNLLKEITENWIPVNCQFWTASHSLGFIEYAKQSEKAVILDFDDLNFDEPQVISPQSKENLEIYDIAVPKEILFNILSGKKLIVCENQNDAYYNLIGLNDTIFVGVKDSRDTFLHIKRDKRYFSLRDRDFLSDTEIGKIQKEYPNHRILKYYDFENYLYHPDNIEELKIKNFNKESFVEEILKQKKSKIDYILPTLISSRQTYEEFKGEGEKLRDKDTNNIVDDFKSDEFDRYYKYFDMKSQFDKSKFASVIPDKKLLVKTKWFKEQIEKCLNENN